MPFKMAERMNIPNSETLFAFDLLVEYIRIDKEMKVSDELALGVRLLDFPTLLIYQPQQADGHVIPLTIQENENRERENHLCPRPGGDKHAFNKGKSCLFKMNLDSLHKHLSNTPLYAMVLDVKDEVPKLVGSSQISLAKPMDRIKSDVNARGISTPSCQGEKLLIDIFNLMGEKIGLISLGYKLLSLGASLLPHISENKGFKTGGAFGGENTCTTETLPNESELNLHDKPGLCENVQQNGQSTEKVVVHEAKQEVVISAATQTEHRPRSKSQQTLQVNDFNFEEDVTVFCPPHLFYNSTVEKTSKNKSDDYKLLKLDLESFMVEDASSKDEASEREYEGLGYPVIDQGTRRRVKQSSSSEHKETDGLTPNALGETLRQLPLLNALLVELSQLNGQTQQQQPLPIHPNLAWIYRPGLGNTLTDVHTTSPLHKTPRESTSPRLKDIPHPQNCSTPQGRSVSGRQVKKVKREDVCLVSKPPRKRLVYGTTKTLRLRLKQITPGVERRRECVELTETQTQKTKGKISNANKKHADRKKMFRGSPGLDENIDTVICGIAVDASPQEPTTLKKINEDGVKPQRSPDEVETSCCGRRDNSLKPSERSLHSKEEKKLLIHVPNVYDQDAAQNGHDSNVCFESNETQTESDRSREKGETTGSSRFNSPKSSCSIGSSIRREEVEYPDDFTSLEPSDGYSPDPIDVVYSPEPLSSPEPASAKTQAKTRTSSIPGDFYNSDSASERVQRRSAALPVPVKADSSPQRSLKSTHIIRPRTRASALSVSSDNDEGDGSASIHTVRSRNQMTSSCRTKRSSVTESLRSSRSQQSDSSRNSVPVRGVSGQSVSSFEPQEAEELEDELSSLGFTNRYRHVSELVANKLPGYTL